jgi:hypothetical protein
MIRFLFIFGIFSNLCVGFGRYLHNHHSWLPVVFIGYAALLTVWLWQSEERKKK